MSYSDRDHTSISASVTISGYDDVWSSLVLAFILSLRLKYFKITWPEASASSLANASIFAKVGSSVHLLRLPLVVVCLKEICGWSLLELAFVVKVRAVAAAAAAGAGTSITVEKDKKLRPADGSVDGVSTFVVVSFVFFAFLLNRRLGILVHFLQCKALKRVLFFCFLQTAILAR